MPITYNEDYFKKIQAIAAIIKDEGCAAYSCREHGECWLSLCGLQVCFIGRQAVCLKSSDMEVRLICVPVANDNPENRYVLSSETCGAGHKTAIHFVQGTPDTLQIWYKEITSFAPHTARR